MIIILWEGRIFILLYFTDYQKGISFLEAKNISITNGPVLKEFFLFAVSFTSQTACRVLWFTFVRTLCSATKILCFAHSLLTVGNPFETTTFLCSHGFCCFQRCVDLIWCSVGGLQITILQVILLLFYAENALLLLSSIQSLFSSISFFLQSLFF